jgi:hypothetical protein
MLVMSDKAKLVQIMAWSASVLVSILAFVAWGSSLQWQLAGISSYQLFPLFGLLAFSIMWSHYMAATVRISLGLPKPTLAKYFDVTGWVVLFLIVMHPGLLIWQLWRDGLGLPPESYLRNYVAPKLRWAALLGTVSLFLFLAYEFRRWYAERKWWHWIEHITDVAMILIFIHALRLGTNLMRGWFRGIWMIYGASLAIFLIFLYYQRYMVTPIHRK